MNRHKLTFGEQLELDARTLARFAVDVYHDLAVDWLEKDRGMLFTRLEAAKRDNCEYVRAWENGEGNLFGETRQGKKPPKVRNVKVEDGVNRRAQELIRGGFPEEDALGIESWIGDSHPILSTYEERAGV